MFCIYSCVFEFVLCHFFWDWMAMNPFSISCTINLLVMNSLHFCLSETILVFRIVLLDIEFLVDRVLFHSSFFLFCYFFQDFKYVTLLAFCPPWFLRRNQLLILWRTQYIWRVISSAAFKILSLWAWGCGSGVERLPDRARLWVQSQHHTKIDRQRYCVQLQKQKQKKPLFLNSLFVFQQFDKCSFMVDHLFFADWCLLNFVDM